MQLYPIKKITEYLIHHFFKTVFALGIFTWSIYMCFFREISLEQSYLGIGKEVIFRFICIIAIIITPAKFIRSIGIVICTALDLVFRSEKEYIIHGFVCKNGKLAFGDQYMIINTVFGKNMFVMRMLEILSVKYNFIVHDDNINWETLKNEVDRFDTQKLNYKIVATKYSHTVISVERVKKYNNIKNK